MTSRDAIEARVHGPTESPALIYLPGLHGDWTLVASFRAAMRDRVRFVEFAYPCRTDWTLDDYAHAVLGRLAEQGITQGWVIGESFGSQVAWKLIEQSAGRFAPQGLILAGGFVRHPVTLGVHAFHAMHGAMPGWVFSLLLKGYARYARLRHRNAPETRAGIEEFVARRTPADRAAIGSRYPLIARADLRPLARSVRLPVYALSGFFDPIVPWPLVHPWLEKHCPGFRERRIVLNADHNVLGTAPRESAEQIALWMKLP